MSLDWPHAPVHRLDSDGIYIVTAGTLNKTHLFGDEDKLTLLEQSSAAWFERVSAPAMVKTIYGFKTDKLKIHDDF